MGNPKHWVTSALRHDGVVQWSCFVTKLSVPRPLAPCRTPLHHTLGGCSAIVAADWRGPDAHRPRLDPLAGPEAALRLDACVRDGARGPPSGGAGLKAALATPLRSDWGRDPGTGMPPIATSAALSTQLRLAWRASPHTRQSRLRCVQTCLISTCNASRRLSAWPTRSPDGRDPPQL